MHLKANESKHNIYLPIDTYVPVEYFIQKNLFMKNYNFAKK